MHLNFRIAQPDDIPAINLLIAQSIRSLHADSYDPAVIEEAVRHAYGVDWQLVRDETYYVAVKQGHIVAAGGWSYRHTIAGAHGADDPPAPELDWSSDAARIRAFYVAPTAARSGIGRMLLAKSEAAAWTAGFRRAELTSTLPAIAFYRAAGYRDEGAYDLPLPSGVPLRLRLMRKALKMERLTTYAEACEDQHPDLFSCA